MADCALWQEADVEIRVGATTRIDLVLQAGVQRQIHFPVPAPDWGQPHRVDCVLRRPDGSEYWRDDFDPRQGLPHGVWAPLSIGTWTIELTTDDGRRFAGAFTVDSLAPSLETIRVAVQPR